MTNIIPFPRRERPEWIVHTVFRAPCAHPAGCRECPPCESFGPYTLAEAEEILADEVASNEVDDLAVSFMARAASIEDHIPMLQHAALCAAVLWEVPSMPDGEGADRLPHRLLRALIERREAKAEQPASQSAND